MTDLLTRQHRSTSDRLRGGPRVWASLLRLLWAAGFVLAPLGANAQTVLTTLHLFQPLQGGATPHGGLIEGSDRWFYGTTWMGGSYGQGTIFKISTNGVLTSLYSFHTPSIWANDLTQGSDGNFYGTTYNGGADDSGSAFKVSPGGEFTILYSFHGDQDGAHPAAGLVQASDGNFYGTTWSGGGTNGNGTVFKISPTGTFTSLYAFAGGHDGMGPAAGLIEGSDHNFYGTTEGGGTDNRGTVFRISPNGYHALLHDFGTNNNDGFGCSAALVQGRDGDFYGVTETGINSGGTVFKISSSGTYTTLYSFTDYSDGRLPFDALVEGRDDGFFYGTTQNGGTNDFGTVFKISPTGQLTSLYSFSNPANQVPPGPKRLVQGRDGEFYGTTELGGPSELGSIFRISSGGDLTNLYTFVPTTDGSSPYNAPVLGRDGNFYGTTVGGGANNDGVVFRISATGAYTNLYSFAGDVDGEYPSGGLVAGSDGSFYGTTQLGGANNFGTVFKITTNGVLTTLHSFTGLDGQSPFGGLVEGNDGRFYGSAQYGPSATGRSGNGTLFRISTNGTFATLYSFAGGFDGKYPQARLVQGSDGYFYGSTLFGGTNDFGTLFKITPDGTLTHLSSFTTISDGTNPYVEMVRGSDGNLYGTTPYGGAKLYGTIFKIDVNGKFSTVYSFKGGSDGSDPSALLAGSDGNLYGTALGTVFGGTIFKFSTGTGGAFTTLYSTVGEFSPTGLVQGGDGSLYGSAQGLVNGSGGAIFRLDFEPAFQSFSSNQGTLSLAWSVQPGATYQLQYNFDLGSTNWINSISSVTASGATLNVTVSVTNGPAGFYRLALLP